MMNAIKVGTLVMLAFFGAAFGQDSGSGMIWIPECGEVQTCIRNLNQDVRALNGEGEPRPVDLKYDYDDNYGYSVVTSCGTAACGEGDCRKRAEEFCPADFKPRPSVVALRDQVEGLKAQLAAINDRINQQEVEAPQRPTWVDDSNQTECRNVPGGIHCTLHTPHWECPDGTTAVYEKGYGNYDREPAPVCQTDAGWSHITYPPESSLRCHLAYLWADPSEGLADAQKNGDMQALVICQEEK